MRVYMINSVCGYGSTGRIATDLCKIIEENGGTYRIAYGRGVAPRDANTYRIGSEVGVRIHGVLSRFTDRQGFYSTHATRKLVSDIEGFSPDIIHLHNVHGYYLNIRILLEFLARYDRPVVLTMHDCWIFTGHCAHFFECEKWKSENGGCQHCPHLLTYPKCIFLDNSKKNWLEKKQLFNSIKNITYIAPAKWLTKIAHESFLSENKEARFCTINNGIDLSLFDSVNCPEGFKPNDRIRLLGVASPWYEEKGFADFLKLGEELSSHFEIVLVGMDSTREYIGKNGARVSFITRTSSQTELAMWYSSADALLNLSKAETFPTVIIEALACGTGVITYDVGGSAEIVRDEDGQVNLSVGRVIKPGDFDSLLATLHQLEQNENLFCFDACINQAKRYDKNDKYLEYFNYYKSFKN